MGTNSGNLCWCNQECNNMASILTTQVPVFLENATYLLRDGPNFLMGFKRPYSQICHHYQPQANARS